MLSFSIKTFTCSKAGNSSIENEDAFSIPPLKIKDTYLRTAIADGATESSFSREWADLLVSYYYTFDFRNETFSETLLPTIKRSWLERINVIDLPWYAQQKMEMGAFASFLGLDVNLENGDSKIIAVGDSNIFIFRNNKMVLTFPIEKAIDFGTTPFLISSEIEKNQKESHFFLEKDFKVFSEDILLLCTDAISHLILHEVEIGNNPVNEIMELLSGDIDNQIAFQKWLD